ncbi:helix-turn-helix transcriptional regulator [Planomonospora corallina]|uniref:Helix-turn-helix transcriptional regulator n=1 Tax=Planomonospora corallina TaxID=1806052 RepID=A0ABV8I8M7_9ACTN
MDTSGVAAVGAPGPDAVSGSDAAGGPGTAGGPSREGPRGPDRPAWTFLSNHAHVLVCLDRAPDATMREVAAQVGITLRAVQSIVADLAAEGYLLVERRGRRNHYTLDRTRPLRHPLERHTSTGELLAALFPPSS